MTENFIDMNPMASGGMSTVSAVTRFANWPGGMAKHSPIASDLMVCVIASDDFSAGEMYTSPPIVIAYDAVSIRSGL